MALRESQKLYTVEEFEEIAALAENEERRLELDDGVIVEMGSSSKLNTFTTLLISSFLIPFVVSRQLGYLSGPDGGYVLSPGRVRRPDLGFITLERGVNLVGIDYDRAPDLAIEIASPHEDTLKKAREYFDAGTRLVRVVYAEEQTVIVLTPDEDKNFNAHRLSADDMLDGGDVLPGFSVRIKAIFPGY